jgi:hypothetical protein
MKITALEADNRRFTTRRVQQSQGGRLFPEENYMKYNKMIHQNADRKKKPQQGKQQR